MRQESLNIAKITRTRVQSALFRTRLFRLLDCRNGAGIMWVGGSPGSGKSTLVSSYVESRKLPCLWYQVDEGDADVATFFYYLGLAAQKASNRKRTPLPHLTPEYLPGISAFTRRFFESLYSRVKTPSVVVFDNYQQAPTDSLFHEVIRDGLSVLPEGVSVILISREYPPPALVRMRANGQMTMLTGNDLRLTREEIEDILLLKGMKQVRPETVEQLHERTDGWAAGLVLMLENARLEDAGTQSVGGKTPEAVFDYFAGEILAKTREDVSDFLLKTAVFPDMTAEITEALTGNPKAGSILSELSVKNFFTLKSALREETYQYHPLFREFLLSRAKEVFPPEEFRKIEYDAASVLGTNGRAEYAMELFLKSEAWSEAIRIILMHAQIMLTQGRGRTLEGWIRALPEAIVETTPWLLLWTGACRLPFAPDQSSTYFEKAYGLFEEQKDAAGVFLSLSGMVDSVTFGNKTYREFDRLIPLLSENLEKFSDLPTKDIEAKFVISFIASHVLRRPDMLDIGHWEKRGLDLAESIGDSNASAHIIGSFGFYHVFSGNLDRAAYFIDIYRRIANTRNISPFYQIFLWDLEAFHSFLAADFDRNRTAIEKGLALADYSGMNLHNLGLLGHGASSALSAGDLISAEQLLQKMAFAMEMIPNQHNKALYHLLSGWKSLLKKELKQAQQQAGLAMKLGIESGVPLTEAWLYILNALVHHELSEDDKAIENITHARSTCIRVKNYQAQFRCLLAGAQFAFDRGDENLGLEQLREAMAIGREHGYANTFFWISSVMAKLCVKALEAGIEVEYVKHLIRRRNLVSDSPPYECENWPWPIKIFTLGRFGLIKEGTSVQSSRKEQQRPLSMLKALIAFGGREVEVSKLTDILWPDAEGDAAFSAFTTTLSRLRQLLEVENAIQVRKGRVTLDSQYCYVDAWAFERLAGKIEELCKERQSNASHEEVIRLADKALAMYRGAFLSADDEHWVISYRERLRSKFLRFITKIGQYLAETGQWEKDVEYYRRALEVDDLTEEFYQCLMICYQHLGQQAEAMKVYRRCCSVLSAVLRIEPSSKTEDLYKTLAADFKVQS